MNKFSIIIALTAVLAVASSCRSAQKAVVADTRAASVSTKVDADWKKSAYNPLTAAAAAKDWTDFSASGNISISTSSSLSSAMQLKMVRGKSISISIRPILGIEMGKLFIDKDSVTLVDKYHSIYMRESVSQFLGDGIGLNALQDLLLSRPFDLSEGSLTTSNAYHFTATAPDEDDMWEMRPVTTTPLFSYFFNMFENNISKFNVTLNDGQSYALNFDNYKQVGDGTVASSINARVAVGGMAVQLDIRYTKSLRWNNGISDSISIPVGAQRYSFAQVIKSLTK